MNPKISISNWGNSQGLRIQVARKVKFVEQLQDENLDEVMGIIEAVLT